MSTTVKAVLSTVLAVCAIAATFALILAHASDAQIGILIAVITTQVPSLVNLFQTNSLSQKVQNGLIPDKVNEALNNPLVQKLIKDRVVKPAVTEMVQAGVPVVPSTTPDTPTGTPHTP